MNNNAVMIQTCWRCYKTKTDYALLLWGVVSFQSIVRGHLQVLKYRQLRMRLLNDSATMIQSQWRSYKATTDYALSIWGTISLQSVVRGYLQVQRYRQLQWERANESATKIQSVWRAYKGQTDYALAIWGIISLQSCVRGHLQIRKYQQSRWQHVNERATRIQTCWRSFKTRRDYLGWQEVSIMATRIQACWRSYKATTDYALVLWGTISFQSVVRGRIQVRRYQALQHELQWYEVNLKATQIQSRWRAFKGERDFALMIWGIICLQSLVRSKLTVQKYRQVQLRQYRAAVKIQTAFRSHTQYTGKILPWVFNPILHTAHLTPPFLLYFNITNQRLHQQSSVQHHNTVLLPNVGRRQTQDNVSLFILQCHQDPICFQAIFNDM